MKSKNMDTDKKLEELLDRYTKNTISPSEYDEFFVMVSREENKDRLSEVLEMELSATGFSFLGYGPLHKIWNNVIAETWPAQDSNPDCQFKNPG